MTASTTFFHVSDIHFGVEDEAAHQAFVDAVAAERPDAVICTGDITQRATHRQFGEARAWLNAFDVPVLVQPGNHDLPYYSPFERWRNPFKRFETIAPVQGELELDHAIIVTLNTNARAQWRWPWSDGVIRETKLDRTIARLKAWAHDPRPKFVACHHPLLPAHDDEDNPTIGGDEAFAALAKAGAIATLSGHVHFPFDMGRDRQGHAMRMIGAGTLSTRLRGAPPSYNVVTISADGAITVEARETQ